MSSKKNKTTQHSSARQKELDPIFAQLKTYAEKNDLFPDQAIVVIGLSGGPDSVFLFHFLLELQKEGSIKKLIAAHLDHEWRAEAEKDMLFCKALADRYHIPFETAKLSKLPEASSWKGSAEEIARKARRTFLAIVAQKYNANAIALGHHAQDQQETFLIRLLRGASLTGLCGMQAKAGLYVRPLLQTNKADILAYLDAHHIAYLQDPTNVSPLHLRNRIRATVIPALKEADARFDTTFQHTLHKLQQAEAYLDAQAQTVFESVYSDNAIDIAALLEQPALMRERVILKWLYAEKVPFTPTDALLQEIIRFLCSPHGGSHSVHPDWIIQKKGKVAWLIKR